MAQKESSHHLRLGVDFGFGFTGVALLDGARVLDRAVISHGADISQLLQSRRENRAMHRRNRSRRKRLRDFRALLKEMKFAPILPAEDEETKNRPGNQLYGIAHWRGWDYAELDKLLMDEPENGTPHATQTVRDVDNSLKKHLSANRLKHCGKPKKDKRDSSIERWEQAGKLLAEGKPPPPELLRYAELKTSCLGELADAFRRAQEAKKEADKKSDDDDALIADAEKAQNHANELRNLLRGNDGIPSFDKISDWINERLDAVFDGEISAIKRGELCDEILPQLGLADGKEAFEKGGIYRPHRNRHRQKSLEELRGKMREILDDAGRESEFEKWIKRAEAIINQRQRPMRVDNRRPGKCPALDEETGVRCGCNVPRRDKPDIRRLLFEIEARQMNIDLKNEDEPRKLSENEIVDLLACVDFEKHEIRDEKWRAFFKRLPTPPRKSDEDGESLRNKKDQLRDIVCSGKKGRTGYCRKHLAEKVRLLKNDETEGSRWAALHGERILGRADANPSLLYRVDKILSVVRKMLADAKIADPKIEHIGVESARFDIASLSSLEGGRKLKKAAYSKPRGRSLKSLSDAQNGLCLFCGETMGANATVDHIFARARKGGDSWKNRAAMCAACNTQKWKLADVRLNPKAMAALAENEPGKAEFLRMRMDKSESLYSQNFSAAQATMFGGRIICGALAEMLFGDENAAKNKKIFPIERAADLARLRERWFPEINRKKRAHRAIKRTVKPKEGSGVTLNAGQPPHEEVIGELQYPDKKLPGFIAEKNGVFTFSPIPNRDEGVRTLWLKDGDGGRPFRIVVHLKEGDTAKDFHHAIDAIIAAAPADWNRIARMAKNAKTRSRKAADVFEEEIKKARPLTCDGKPYPDSSPEHPGDDWLIEQKADKSGFNRAKTKREPLGLWKDRKAEKTIIVQRKPLDRLPRKNIPDITDAAEKIREALQKAWEEIDSFPPEKREKFVEKISGKSGECISHRWFLQLPESHILHPKNTRSVPVKIGKPERAFIVKRKGPDGKPVLHRFDREEYWGEVAVWEINGKRDFSRRRPPFYVNADNPQEWENDKAPPENIKDKNIFGASGAECSSALTAKTAFGV